MMMISLCLGRSPGKKIPGSSILVFDTSFLMSVCLSVGTPAGKTPGSGLLIGDTPLNLQNVDAAAIQRAAADLPTNVLNTLQQVAGQHAPFQAFQVNDDDDDAGIN